MARRGENIYKRKDGRYEGRYIKSYDINGKAKYGYVYSRSYVGIKEKLENCKTEKIPQTSGSVTPLSEWLALWIESENDIKISTRFLYERHIFNNIIPKIGNIQLRKLSAEVLQVFVNSLAFAPSTVRLVFSILKSALICAEDRGLINNVWSKVKLPKRKKSEVEILTIKEQRKLESVLSEKNDIGILICLYTGLRIGELCALKWSDIDFDNAVMRICGTQARIDGKLTVTTPKSKSSDRIIPIPDFLLEKLKAVKSDNEFVLSSKKGGMVDVRNYRKRFKGLLKLAGLPDIRYHILRHTFSSRALEVGMDYKTLSEILGHASVSITMDLYVHSLDEHKRNQMSKMNAVYNSPSE